MMLIIGFVKIRLLVYKFLGGIDAYAHGHDTISQAFCIK